MKEKLKNLDTVERATLYLTWSLCTKTHKHETIQKEEKLATRKQFISEKGKRSTTKKQQISDNGKRLTTKKQLIAEKGITLLALVVTIIIMLILAGVTISVALSDGGLIDTTKEAVNRQRIAEMKTKIELIVTNWTARKMLNDNVTVEDLKQALVDEGVTSSKDKITGSDGKYEVETKDGDIFEIIIDESGNIKVNLKGEGSGGEEPGGDDKPGEDKPQASLEISVTGATTNSVSVQVTTNSLEGNTITYSYKEAGATEYTVVKQNSNETSHTFVGLGSNTSYSIKVELKDAEGKVIAEKEIETKTEEQKIGTISQKGELTWNNGKASLELQSTEPTDVIQYQVGGSAGEWQDYTGPIGNLNSGDTVYVKVKGSSVETSIPIVDGIAPTVTVQRGTVNTSSITAVVTASDDESGMPTSPTYQYYIKKTSEANYPQNPSYTGSNMSNAFTGLIQGTSYDIKVTVRDVAGNEGTGFLNNISTENVGGASGGLATGNITLGATTWNNGLATVTLNTTTSLSIQYQKNSNTEGNWTTAGATATITDLQHGDTIFARLWDGTNAGSDASVSIIDDKEPQIAGIELSSTETTTGETITATVTLTDNESGIHLTNSRWIYTNSSTPLGTEDVSKYTGGNFATNPQTLNLTAEEEGTYYLHVLSVDNGGNKKETVSSGVEIAGKMKTDGSYNAEKGVNSPKLGTGMTAITWNGSSWVEPETDDEWYSYTETDKKWANAKTSDGSMWVWVPRYAYQIESGYHSNTAGVINIKFLKGTSNEATDGTTSWDNASGQGNWNIHPAFTSNTAMGGWKEEIPGVWVAKFEASKSNATATSSGSSSTLKIQPGVVSYSIKGVTEGYKLGSEYNKSLSSHMMKNSEWGCVAYLSISIYGTNQKIWINPNKDYITGQAGDSVSVSTTTTTNAYNTTNGQKASTTGNIYGIYDMVGGKFEYVASYLDNKNTNLTTYGSDLVNSKITHFKQIYNKGSSDTDELNYKKNSAVYGDAVYETSNNYNNITGSWNGETAVFPSLASPFFKRGGRSRTSPQKCGIFAFDIGGGAPDGSIGFRPVLVAP